MRAFLLALGLAGCHPAYRAPVFEPHEITYEDGSPALQVGPFRSRMEMRTVLGRLCQQSSGGYEILDGDDRATSQSLAHGVAVGYTTIERSDTIERHAITVIYRCK